LQRAGELGDKMVVLGAIVSIGVVYGIINLIKFNIYPREKTKQVLIKTGSLGGGYVIGNTPNEYSEIYIDRS
jgi:hypothetical protein